MSDSLLAQGYSITDSTVRLPSAPELIRVLTLADYNTRVVMLGTMLLGCAAGIIGTFMLLRKRALMGDALSHATLPGIGLAFMIMVSLGGSGKYLPGLLLGAMVSGILGLACVLANRNLTLLKEDAALGIVLSVFFGLGIAVLGLVQKMQQGSAAGLESFIYGKTASMLASDAYLIAAAAMVTTAACLLLFKEFATLCFDQNYARTQGWPTLWLDVAMMAMVTLVTVIGLQAVGLILMIALLVIPPAAARFWTNHLPTMVFASAGIGALSGFLGAGLSALVPRLPAGAIIVLVATGVFVISMLLGPARGVLVRALEHVRMVRKVRRQHLLRAMFERTEPQTAGDPILAHTEPVSFGHILEQRSWSPAALRRAIRSAMRGGLLRRASAQRFALTRDGAAEAFRVVRNHRLWELYLIHHADIAPSHVDREADELEHVLGPAMVASMETKLRAGYPDLAMPPSPHVLSRAEAVS